MEKAIEYFYNQMEIGKIESDYQQEIFEIAISALEKQIPKKPNKSFNGMESLVVCDCGANAYIFPRSFKGCPYCLQRIDWEEEE